MDDYRHIPREIEPTLNPFCECGCGQRVTTSRKTDSAKGHRKGLPFKFIRGHGNRRRGPEYIVDQETNCWLWQGSCVATGYGHVGNNGRIELAHRVYYERLVGAIPDGLVVDHLCSNRGCVNPAHMELVTQTENCQRGRNAKLTRANVIAIRNQLAHGDTCAHIATEYGVSPSAISDIKRGATWAE